MRFTLGKMFAAIGMLALACAGMMYRNLWWLNGIVTITAVMYVIAMRVAVASSGRQRISAAAFGLVGGGYLLFMCFDGFATIRDSLLTNHVLSLIWEVLIGRYVQLEGKIAGEIQDTIYRVYHDRSAVGYHA